MLQLTTSTPDFQTQVSHLMETRPHYVRECACGHKKVNFTDRANDPEYVAKRQKGFVCDTCKKSPKVEPIEEPKVVTPKATKEQKVAAKIEKATVTGGKLRMAEMFSLGRIKAGDQVVIRGKANTSQATVIDAKNVQFGDQKMTWNQYGETVTGHKAVNIYIHAEVNGTLLDTLRKA